MPRSDEERTVPKRVNRDTPPGDRDTASLIVLRGPHVGELHKIFQSAVIGRGADADVRILDDGISRKHAIIRVVDEEIIPPTLEMLIEDLGSRNGTFVNGDRITGSTVLKDGDKIQLSSSTILKFTYVDRLDESFQRRMFESALRDGLTKAFNRRYFLDRLEREFRYAKRHREPLALLLLDIDMFKRINDTYGHVAGDQALVTLAQEVYRTIRSEDVFARTAGEEFAIIFRATDISTATALAERLRSTVATAEFTHDSRVLPLTISLGVAAMHPSMVDSSALIAAADEALYVAKRSGRNRVHVAGTPETSAAGSR